VCESSVLLESLAFVSHNSRSLSSYKCLLIQSGLSSEFFMDHFQDKRTCFFFFRFIKKNRIKITIMEITQNLIKVNNCSRLKIGTG